jgi:hypothetical protein
MADADVTPLREENASQDRTRRTGRTRRRRPRNVRHQTDSIKAWLRRPIVLEAVKYASAVFLGVRLGTFLLGLLAAGLLPPRTYVDVPDRLVPRDSGWDTIFTAWERQDALWYLRIADLGYRLEDHSAAFFPLFPAVVRGVGAILRDDRLLLSGLIVSNVCLLAALIVIYLITVEEFDTGIARKTILYLMLFPYALFFMAPYTESLFLLLSALALWAIRKERWLTAGSVGALAALTRSAGVVLTVVVVLGGLVAARRTRSWRPVAGAIMAATLISGGLALYLGYWHVRFGDAARPMEAQEAWSRGNHLPWETMAIAVAEAVESPGKFHGGYAQLHLLLVLIGIGAVVWLARRAATIYTAYVLLSLLLPMVWASSLMALLSVPRFVSVLFPVFWALARFGERYRIHDVIVAVFACGLGICILLFVSSYYIH